MTALDTVLAYYQAWTSHDFDLAMTCIADDITCHAPAGPIVGAEAFRAFMEPFSQILRSSELHAAFGDETTALLMYGTSTHPVADAPARNSTPSRTARSRLSASSSTVSPSSRTAEKQCGGKSSEKCSLGEHFCG